MNRNPRYNLLNTQPNCLVGTKGIEPLTPTVSE